MILAALVKVAVHLRKIIDPLIQKIPQFESRLQDRGAQAEIQGLRPQRSLQNIPHHGIDSFAVRFSQTTPAVRGNIL